MKRSIQKKLKAAQSKERDDGVIRMVQYQCDNPEENAAIEALIARVVECIGPELNSGDGVQVARCLMAGIRVAHVAGLMMGMTGQGVYLAVAETLKNHVNETSARMPIKEEEN